MKICVKAELGITQSFFPMLDIQGVAPTVSVDNTTGCQLYLTKDSLEASITTAKSSEINVMVPGANPEDDPVYFSVIFIY